MSLASFGGRDGAVAFRRLGSTKRGQGTLSLAILLERPWSSTLYSPGMPGAEIDVDLVAASLRASSSDLKTFVEVLAEKLEGAFPDRVQVERRSTRFLGKEKRVERIQCQVGDARYVLSTRGGLETLRAKAVRGVVLKTDELSFEEWLDALAHDLAAEARTNEQAQLALQQLLVG